MDVMSDAAPSTTTVHAPQEASSQPRFVPVSASFSRKNPATTGTSRPPEKTV